MSSNIYQHHTTPEAGHTRTHTHTHFPRRCRAFLVPRPSRRSSRRLSSFRPRRAPDRLGHLPSQRRVRLQPEASAGATGHQGEVSSLAGRLTWVSPGCHQGVTRVSPGCHQGHQVLPPLFCRECSFFLKEPFHGDGSLRQNLRHPGIRLKICFDEEHHSSGLLWVLKPHLERDGKSE